MIGDSAFSQLYNGIIAHLPTSDTATLHSLIT